MAKIKGRCLDFFVSFLFRLFLASAKMERPNKHGGPKNKESATKNKRNKWWSARLN